MSKIKVNNQLVNNSILCRNCDFEFTGNYCPNCGQSTKEFEKPFGFLLIDLMGNVFAFDTRFWKTLKTILLKPGKMAFEYSKGRRVRYMPPFRFYVFISFIFFFLVNYNTSQSIQENRLSKKQNNIIVNISEEDSSNINTLNSIIADSSKILDIPKNITNGINLENKESKNGADIINIERIKDYPEVYLAKLFKYFSWTIFFLMPFYGFLLWLFFHKSHRFYITHLILAINQHSLTFLVFLVIAILSNFIPGDPGKYGNFLILAIPIYHYIGYKQLYKQRGSKTFFKMIAIGLIYFSVVFITLTIVALLAFEINLSNILHS